MSPTYPESPHPDLLLFIAAPQHLIFLEVHPIKWGTESNLFPASGLA